MKRRLRVPGALLFTLGGATIVAAASTTLSCDRDDPPQDAASCAVFCYDPHVDGGVPIPDGGCPQCADLNSGGPVCPGGCVPLG